MANMRLIKPEETTLTIEVWRERIVEEDGERVKKAVKEEDTVKFSDFIEGMLNLPDWGEDWKAIDSAGEIADTLKAATGGVLKLHESVWEKLVDVMKKPSRGYAMTPHALRQCRPFFKAVFNASEAKG